MTLIQASIAPIPQDCPDIVMTDNTDYSIDVQVVWNFEFHDYSGGNPAVNETFTYTELNIGTDNLITTPIVIETDGAGNIIDPEIQYNALIDQINTFANYEATLVKPPLTSYKQWYLQIGSFDLAKDGDAVSVVVSPATINPLITQTSSGAVVDARNMVLFDPEGKIIPFGAVAQVEEINFVSGIYPAGETFTLTFCGDVLQYTPEIDTSGTCMAKEFTKLINEATDNKYALYTTASCNGSVLTITASIPGVPLQITPSYTLVGTYWSQTTTVANQPNMELPSFDSENSIVYTPKEKGGKYRAFLVIVSGCDYSMAERIFYNWCYDIANFSCCFINSLNVSACNCNANNNSQSCIVYSIIKGVNLMITSGFSEPEIQKVVDLGWSICEPLDCGTCFTCGNKGSCSKRGGKCGCNKSNYNPPTNPNTGSTGGGCGCS